jgi:hypothetical protein
MSWDMNAELDRQFCKFEPEYLVLSTQYTARIIATCIVLAAVVGCGQSGPVRAAIEGKVTVGGQPLAAGRILFTPIAPNQGPAASARIAAGQYKLAANEGPVVGANRVEVEADLNLGFAIDDEAAFARRGGRPLPPNSIPPAFNSQSTLTADVKAGGENSYDFAIPARGQSARR